MTVKYKQVEGKHVHLDGTKTEAGAVVISDQPLSKMFPKRFRELSEEESEIFDLRASRQKKKKRLKPVDVTDEFPEAIDKNHGVTRFRGKYQVSDESGEFISEVLPSKKAVSDFISGYAPVETEPTEED
jgi:hypothetical protein